MPIYEFYCQKCHTIYNFFSRSVNTETIPKCPKCKKVDLERQVSIFASISSKKGEEKEGGMPDLPDFDESKMEKAMNLLAGEMDKVNEDDPRQAADLMRKLSEATGLKMGPGMEEALSRMEKGEDPEKIEAEMGDLLEGEEPFILEAKKKGEKTSAPPNVDETLYEL